MKMCRDSEDAKDVLQDTLLAAARGLPEFRGASSLSSWLFTIARSYCIKKRRKTSRGAALARASQETSDLEAAVDPGVAPDELASGRQLGVALDAAIDALDPTLSRGARAPRRRGALRARGRAGPWHQRRRGQEPPPPRARRGPRQARAGARAAQRGGGGWPDLPRRARCVLEAPRGRHQRRRVRAYGGPPDGLRSLRGACDSLRQTLALCRTTRSAEVPPQVQASVRAALRGLFTELA
jgi:RNA polymerase sigma-70 factor (ECF subfamily)